jgi:hypothetical protein
MLQLRRPSAAQAAAAFCPSPGRGCRRSSVSAPSNSLRGELVDSASPKSTQTSTPICMSASGQDVRLHAHAKDGVKGCASGGLFNGWLAESAVSILLCFNRHLGFKSVVIKIIPFAADVHPCTILATPCIHARRMSSHAPFYCGRTSCAEAKNFYLFQLLFVYINRKWYERDYSI